MERQQMMKRRDFSAWCGGALAVAGAGLAPAGVLAQDTPREGAQYRKLDTRQSTDAPPDKIEVLEFFRYSCPHCAAFEPTLEAWVKRLPKDVVFKRAPVSFGDEAGVLQRLYFSLEAMGLLDRLHAKVFNAIHVERQPLNTPDAIADWVAKQGVDRAKFVDQYKSFTASSKASRASQMQNSYRVAAVPSMAIAGRFITDGDFAGTNEGMLKVMDFLAGELRAKRL
jgi:thiol:disulfide interchange protein DsbA